MGETATKPPIEAMDDYVTAAQYLMKEALSGGDGWALQAIKTLMDRCDTLRARNKELEEGLRRELVEGAYPCQRCGRRDGLDAAVTDEQWAVISGRTDGGGLLCLWCMDELTMERGLEHVPVRLYFAGRALFSVPVDEFTDLDWSEARALLEKEGGADAHAG